MCGRAGVLDGRSDDVRSSYTERRRRVSFKGEEIELNPQQTAQKIASLLLAEERSEDYKEAVYNVVQIIESQTGTPLWSMVMERTTHIMRALSIRHWPQF